MIQLDDIRSLLETGGDQVLSLYLQIDPNLPQNRADTPGNWRIWARQALDDTEARLNDRQRATWNTIRPRVEAYLDDLKPKAKGLALFLAPNLDRAYTLPVPLDRNALTFGIPAIVPLLWLMDEYERYLIVLIDNEEAHFLSSYLGDMGREDALASDRFDFDFRERATRAGVVGDDGDVPMDVIMVRFYRDIAKRMGELLQETGAERVIVGGSEAVANALTEYLIRDKLIPALVGVVEIPLQETDRQVMKHILPTALNYERRQEVNLINGVLDHARAGRAVLGRNAVEAAAKDSTIATLYATWPVEPTGLTDPIYGQVVASGGTVELVRGEAARTLKLEAEGWAARLNPQR